MNGLENLKDKEYPGRFIIIGQDNSSRNVVVYGITGRSPSSQARKLERRGQIIWAVPTKEAIVNKGNRDLLVYPAIQISLGIAVSNGKQTADIHSHLNQSSDPLKVLIKALQRWDYEPDSPIYTPRISGCVLPQGRASMSIIRRSPDAKSIKDFFKIPMTAGRGKMIATYSGKNKDPVLSFTGEPLDIEIQVKSPEKMAEAIYDALGPSKDQEDFRVAVCCVFSNYVDLEDYEVYIINRHERMRARNGKNQ